MDVKVEVFTKDCHAYETHDKTGFTEPSPLQPVPFPSGTCKQLGVGIVGSFHKLPSQFQLAIMLVDYYTKWPEILFCNQVTAEVICDFVRIFNHEGYPGESFRTTGHSSDRPPFKKFST